MGIAHFFDRNVVIRRLKDVSGTDRRSLQATATVEGAIQELDRAARSQQGILEERAFMAWFDVDLDIKEGDVLTDQANGNRYEVKEVTIKDYGINQHKEVLLIEHNA